MGQTSLLVLIIVPQQREYPETRENQGWKKMDFETDINKGIPETQGTINPMENTVGTTFLSTKKATEGLDGP